MVWCVFCSPSVRVMWLRGDGVACVAGAQGSKAQLMAYARGAEGRLSAEVKSRMTAEDWLSFGAAVKSEFKFQFGAP